MTHFVVKMWQAEQGLSGFIVRREMPGWVAPVEPFLFVAEPTGDVFTELRFQHQAFSWVLSRLSEYLQRYPEATASLVRGEGSELAFDTPTLELLRVDPTAAIRELDPAPRRVDIRPPGKLLAVHLRAGYETLASAIGELTWLRARGGSVEHPVTGRWVPLRPAPSGGFFLGPLLVKELALDGESVPGEAHVTARWAAVSTHALLLLNAERYYLPAAHKGWITETELQEKYRGYLKEKHGSST